MATLQILIPVFHLIPVPLYNGVDDPTIMEIGAFCNNIVQFIAMVAPLLAIANPQHRLVAAPQNVPAAGADQAM